MIRFSFRIRNPWGRDLPHRDYFYRHWQVSKNKSFEIQLFRDSFYDLFELNLDLSWRGEDHAGPSLEIGIGKYQLNIKLYDHRHWDYEKGNWEVYDPDQPNNWDYT